MSFKALDSLPAFFLVSSLPRRKPERVEGKSVFPLDIYRSWQLGVRATSMTTGIYIHLSNEGQERRGAVGGRGNQELVKPG